MKFDWKQILLVAAKAAIAAALGAVVTSTAGDEKLTSPAALASAAGVAGAYLKSRPSQLGQ